MKVKRQLRKARNGSVREIFESISPGDIKVIPVGEVNISSLRARAGFCNGAAGYTKYTVSLDSLTDVVRIVNHG